MKKKLLELNNAFLFLCTSMYLGTGWSLVLFSFPVVPQLTIENYYLQFVPQVTAATKFFTYMTMLMIAACIVMIFAQWRTRYRWVPIVVLLGVIAATGLTMLYIIPLNKAMSQGITDPVKLKDILSQWTFMNKIRVGLWTVQWLAMMYYFAHKAYRAGDVK
jgi:hypothetical protein